MMGFRFRPCARTFSAKCSWGKNSSCPLKQRLLVFLVLEQRLDFFEVGVTAMVRHG